MISEVVVYDKYGRGIYDFRNATCIDVARKMEILWVTYRRIVARQSIKASVYWCSTCKKRTAVDDPGQFEVCACGDAENLYFVGFKNSSNNKKEFVYER